MHSFEIIAFGNVKEEEARVVHPESEKILIAFKRNTIIFFSFLHDAVKFKLIYTSTKFTV